MVYRKGELSKYAIDAGWPHQVALPTPIPHLPHIYDWCRGERLSLCQRTAAFYRDGVHFACFCFAERDHAHRFQVRFGGEFIEAKDRPRWGRSRK